MACSCQQSWNSAGIWRKVLAVRLASVIVRALLPLFALASASAQQSKPPNLTQACHDSVQAFYDWYTPLAIASNSVTFSLALEKRPSSFEPRLARLLREDHEAQSRADQIVGLDFDPFVATNGDPCSRYAVEKVTIRNERCFAEVHCVGKAEAGSEMITAELALKGGRWVFADFHYQPGGTLLEILRINRKSRDSSVPK